ncbi:MAG: ABC transporter ATP-binding protein [Planctomycetales bacterium]|nr:ABC transporter ATP-binding protein [Planctomycetales bacterium]
MTQLSVKNLSKQFSSAAETLLVLQDVELEMSAGQNVSIVGPSGCGKSTLLYILGTLDHPSSGHVALDSVDPFALSPSALAHFRSRSIGFIFQDHHLLPQLSVVENVLLPALANGSPSREQIDRAGELIDGVGLGDRQRHLPSQLSGGERQRVAVARALLNRPKLLLADEPTGNLDEDNTRRIAELLFELPQRDGAMLVVVTHSPWLAEQAQRQLRLEKHRLVEHGSLNELAQPS